MINDLFSVPIFRKQLDDMAFVESLEKHILESMHETNRVGSAPQSAHSDLFESKFDFLNWENPYSAHCKTVFMHLLMQFIKEVTQIDDSELAKFKVYHESWFHVVKKGGYFQVHTHPNASWSVVLCVSQGDEVVANDKEAGCLLFLDPRLNASMHLDPANKDMQRKYSFNGYRFRPSSGEIFIFPSYLQHSVEPYFGDKHRISVASNFWFNT